MILPARDKPILSMLEWIRVRLMTRLHTKRIVMEKYDGSVCPNVQDKLEKLKMESRSFSAMPFGRFKYKVDNSYERHMIDLTKKEYSCRIWDLTGIPCKHGVATIYKNLEHPKDYLHDCYLKEAYLDVYSEIIYLMPGQDQWIKSGHLPSQPPHVLRPPGRPKKLRRRDPDEPKNPHKVSRMNRQIKCGKCNKLGHNSRSCNADITGETAWQKRQKLKQQKTVRFQLYMHLNIYFYIFQRFYMHLNIFFFSLFFAFGIGCRHKEEVLQPLIKDIHRHSPHHHNPNHHNHQQEVDLNNGSLPPNQPLMHLERHGIQGPHHPRYFLNFP
jgi:hypothetical protein